jgi:hypothetical protein
MVEAALIMDALILSLIVFGFVVYRMSQETVHDRLDDTIDGVGILATELLKRTEGIRELASRVTPAIELHNHNPLEQIFNAIRAFKTGQFSNNMETEGNINPRGVDGQYGGPITQEEQTEPPASEVVDVID